MDLPVTIRTKLEPGDLGYIAYLHGRQYAEEFGYGLYFENYVLGALHEFANAYDPEKDGIWVCEHEKKKVGFLVAAHREDTVRREDTAHPEYTVQLRFLILLPEYRGAGLAGRLMDLFIAFMRDRGYRKAFLLTTSEQEKAISLYQRYGFYLSEEKESKAFDKMLVERKYELSL
jgi:ribosomal protein S18 acetylase RimI-like enzyme